MGSDCYHQRFCVAEKRVREKVAGSNPAETFAG